MGDMNNLCMQCMLETDKKQIVCPYCGYPVNSKQAKEYYPQRAYIRDRYLVGKMIKRNIDSAVYIGKDEHSGKTVEIREFFPTKISLRGEDGVSVCAAEGYTDIYDEYRESFLHLWKNLMRFKGLPALFDVLEVFEEGGTIYAVTDHNDSTTFRKILDTMNVEENPFSVKRTQTLIMSILSTVESLHTANVVHRGISPETLVLSSDGTLKLTGFAIAQVRTSKNKLLCSVCDGYAPIEQYDFNWQQGSWTDIYSIGALIYKMLTGRTLPPAPARLNDEEVFFTPEEYERIPHNIIELIKGCLSLMPQGRMKDIHDIINVFSPREAVKQTVTAVKSRAVVREPSPKKAELTPQVRPVNAIIPESRKALERESQEQHIEIVKPRQAEAVTKTSAPRGMVNFEQQRLEQEREALEEKKRREELYLEQQKQLEKQKLLEEQKRREREEEIKRKSRERRRKAMENSAAGRAVSRAEEKAEELGDKIHKRIHREKSPVTLAVTISLSVAVICVFMTFLLYGTVLYRYVDAPVLDNCLAKIEFLPVNHANDGKVDVEFVKVADFRTLTREYIENDALYNKKYNIVFEEDYCDTVEKGFVFSQSVQPGEKVAEGSTITVFISKGIEIHSFPDVRGMQFAEAEAQLRQLGFEVTKKTIYNIGIYTAGKVISGSLTVGEEYPRGTAVTLEVWGEPPVTLPSTTEPTQSQQSPQSPIQGGAEGFFSFWRDLIGF